MKKTLLFSLLVAIMALGVFTSCEKDGSSPDASITYFGFTTPINAFGVLDKTTKTVTVNVPYGTDLTNVIGEVTFADTKATISPDITTGVDFSSLSVVFTVTNGGSTETYTVNVIVGENPLRIVMVGDGAMDDLPTEVKTAYNWALTKYGNKAKYVAFADLPSEDISTTKAIWWHFTRHPAPEEGEALLPASATGEALTTVTNFYKAGGNLLLTSLAASYIVEVGRIAADLGPTNLGIPADPYIENPDNWGLSFQEGVSSDPDDYPAGNSSFYLFKDLTLTEVSFETYTYDAIFLSSAGAKKDRAHVWDFNRFYPEMDEETLTPNDKKIQWETDAEAVVRASFEWDPAANGVELGAIVEFKPTTTYTGTAFVFGVGGYEWYKEDGGTNDWAMNVEGITANALDKFIE